MENVVLAIHLILALLLIVLVLLQRSEGGGLGMGGGGGGVVSGRQAATALAKVTWGLAGLFIATSIALTLLAASNSATSSVIDQIGGTLPEPAAELPATPSPLQALPPADAPATPPKAEN
ncbi:preprotein translocase subunit SecG [Stagnihabitans tardus]|uniref:Protein-export membrane protein SecG n=1 Tax=Stagnihabitans tardus TaxID=2699202 RepID=A0AAE4YGQ6_9RHOB|nr:preprotein translocase subunit SecG [Stagnihabitans tardus]NBZ89445.1 preprotein translocase subunit SecG [Stagnihabitans tardus]